MGQPVQKGVSRQQDNNSIPVAHRGPVGEGRAGDRARDGRVRGGLPIALAAHDGRGAPPLTAGRGRRGGSSDRDSSQ